MSLNLVPDADRNLSLIRDILLNPRILDCIDEVEEWALEQEQVPCPLIHHFSPHLYIREITMPPGSFVVGADHTGEHVTQILKGRVLFLDAERRVNDMQGPCRFVAKRGKKVLYIDEETVWQNIYPTDLTDIEAIEALVADKGDAWRNDHEKRLYQPIDPIILEAREDYSQLIDDMGPYPELPPEVAALPYGSYKVTVTDSNIHGRGVHASAPILPGEWVLPFAVKGVMTNLGKMVNHSPSPTTEVAVSPEGSINLFAVKHIGGMMGGRYGDEVTVNYRSVLWL